MWQYPPSNFKKDPETPRGWGVTGVQRESNILKAAISISFESFICSHSMRQFSPQKNMKAISLFCH